MKVEEEWGRECLHFLEDFDDALVEDLLVLGVGDGFFFGDELVRVFNDHLDIFFLFEEEEV